MPWTTPTDFVAGVMTHEAGLDNLSANLTTGVKRKLDEVTLGASAASVTFSAIPATFRNLHVLMLARGTQAAAVISVICRFNADATVANYHSQAMWATGTSQQAAENAPSTLSGVFVGDMPAATSTSSIMYGGYEFRVFDYRSAQEKPVITCGSARWGGAGLCRPYTIGGVWISTAVITSLTLIPTAGSFEAFSRFTLYGEPLPA
jgi:hypothetical protein